MTIRNTIMVALIFSIFSCNGPQGTSSAAFSTEGYEVTDVPGTPLQSLSKTDPAGFLIEQGYLSNGVKNGAWTTYHPNKNLPKTIMNYVNGAATGLYLELNDRGQIELMANYENNKLDGPWGKYRFGRPTQTASYKNGKLEGTYQEYNERDGKIRKEINYKDGEYDGAYKFFNEKGEVTVEYIYENGEKVSGGMVNPDVPNEPK